MTHAPFHMVDLLQEGAILHHVQEIVAVLCAVNARASADASDHVRALRHHVVAGRLLVQLDTDTHSH